MSTPASQHDFGGEPPPSFEPGALPPPPKSSDVRRKLGAGGGGTLQRWLVRAVTLLVLVGAGAGIWLWRARASQAPKYEWVTRPVVRGNLEGSVTATGSLQGRDTVEVGAEVSGIVKAVHVDFNDEVTKGQLLCEIDPDQMAAARDQARAQLVAAQAEHANRKVTAEEARLTAERTKKLASEGLVAQQALEAAVAAADRAKAAVRSAAAQITVAQANLESAQTKLEKTKILSPMDGVVLARSIEVGQTVAASLQAPVLFTLARNLQEMELTVAIDEADIGAVKEGQEATFTVDAYPDRNFQATLERIHNIGTTINNVVTYQALLSVENEDKSLRPGMTATATIITSSRKGVLLVPNAALRFQPPSEGEAEGRGAQMPRIPGMGRPRGGGRPGGGARPGGTGRPAGSAGPWGSARPAGSGAPGGRRSGSRVWVLVDGQPSAVRIRTGLSDGSLTEIVKGELEEGAEVITDVKQPGE